jgi:hypothetical protein
VIWKNTCAVALALQLLPHIGATTGTGYESHDRIRGLAETFALERARSSAPSGAELKSGSGAPRPAFDPARLRQPAGDL